MLYGVVTILATKVLIKVEYLIIIVISLVLALFIKQVKLAINKTKSHTNIYSRKFTITKSQPKYEGENVEYVSVGKDGTAIIKTLFSGELLKAKENEFFAGKDYGSHGLQLMSVSYEEQKMLLKRYLPEDIEAE
jgi:hypothetical protein